MASLHYNGKRRYSRYDTPTSSWESQIDAKRHGKTGSAKFHANAHDSPSTTGKLAVWNKKVDTRSPDTQYLEHMRRVSPDAQGRGSGRGLEAHRGGALSVNDGSLSPAASSRLATRRESNLRRNSIKSYQSLLKERDEMHEIAVRVGDYVPALESGHNLTPTAKATLSLALENQQIRQTQSEEFLKKRVEALKAEAKSAMEIAAAAVDEAERKETALVKERAWNTEQATDAIKTIGDLQSQLVEECEKLNLAKEQYVQKSKTDAEHIQNLMKELAASKAREESLLSKLLHSTSSVTTEAEAVTVTESMTSAFTSPAVPIGFDETTSRNQITSTSTSTSTSTHQNDIDTTKLLVDDAAIEAAVQAARERTGQIQSKSKLSLSQFPSPTSSTINTVSASSAHATSASTTTSSPRDPPPQTTIVAPGLTSADNSSSIPTTSTAAKVKISADMERRFQVAFRLAEAEKSQENQLRSSSAIAPPPKPTVKKTMNVLPGSPNAVNHQRVRDRMRTQMISSSPRLGRSPRVRGMEGRSVGGNSSRFNASDRFSASHKGSRKFILPHQSRVQLS